MKESILHFIRTAAMSMMLCTGLNMAAGQAVGNAGPDFEVDLLGGESFRLSDQSGKVVLVFLFGNTCPSCLAVGPSVEANIFQQFMEEEHFTAVGLDTWDGSSNEASVTAFKNSTGISFPLAIKAGKVASDYVTTYDRLMVIDREGILVHKGNVLVSNDLDNAIAAISESLEATSSRSLQEEPGLKVFPVPAGDLIHFEAASAIRGIRIFNSSGSLVLEEGRVSGPAPEHRSLSLESLHVGLYFYSLELEEGQATGKFLIQR